ncbi:MAG: hypothetical protein ABIE70_03635 [bacterium]
MTSPAEFQERIDKCQKILDADPNSQIFAALAEAYRRKGDLDKAFRICQSGLRIHPSYGSAHVVMAKINLDRRMYDWAEIEAKRAAELDGWTRSTELLLAEIYIYKSQFAEAIKLLKRLHQSDPGNAQIAKLLEIARQLPQQQEPATQVDDGRLPADSEPTLVMTTGETGQPEAEASLTPEQILQRGIAIPGVDGALLVNYDGMVGASEWALEGDVELYGATMAHVNDKLTREVAAMNWGAVDRVLMETEGYTYYLIRQQQHMLVFVVGDASNLGSLRMRLESLLARQI